MEIFQEPTRRLQWTRSILLLSKALETDVLKILSNSFCHQHLGETAKLDIFASIKSDSGDSGMGVHLGQISLDLRDIRTVDLKPSYCISQELQVQSCRSIQQDSANVSIRNAVDDRPILSANKKRKLSGDPTNSACFSEPCPTLTNAIVSPLPGHSEARSIPEPLRNTLQKVRVMNGKLRLVKPRKGMQKDGLLNADGEKADRSLLTYIWNGIFSSPKLAISLRKDLELQEIEITPLQGRDTSKQISLNDFERINSQCLKITKTAKLFRALEIVVQTKWVEYFHRRVESILESTTGISSSKAHMIALTEARVHFGYSEKEMRNKLAIWNGYKQVKDAGGWASLVFAVEGAYTICKYRIGFNDGVLEKLKSSFNAVEVAADTLHPNWRRILNFIGEKSESRLVYTGHPHDWVLLNSTKVLTLKETYSRWDPNFQYSHVTSSVLDESAWGSDDPRRVIPESAMYKCLECLQIQSHDPLANKCNCFPSILGSQGIPAVMVMRTKKNNGLFAFLDFPPGAVIGEFVGVITKGIENKDVMEGGSGSRKYQIFQGRMGNHTRFINHSCNPNTQFQKFVWLGIEKIIVVSRGISAGEEITVDYSRSYWHDLKKTCLCGEPCCRYKDRPKTDEVPNLMEL